jgi:RNA polymerase sigma-70 factor (ECF subfamily)
VKVIEIVNSVALEEPAVAAQSDTVSWDEQFAALVKLHSRYVFRVAYSVLRNVHDAEDAVQETFLKLYRYRRWDQVENERAFLARAVWRIAVDRMPKRTEEPREVDVPAGGQNPEQAAISADRSALVWRMVDSLPEELRQPLALSTVEEMTSQQIAAVMEIPEATVRGRLMRARQILKEKLAAYAR